MLAKITHPYSIKHAMLGEFEGVMTRIEPDAYYVRVTRPNEHLRGRNAGVGDLVVLTPGWCELREMVGR